VKEKLWEGGVCLDHNSGNVICTTKFYCEYSNVRCMNVHKEEHWTVRDGLMFYKNILDTAWKLMVSYSLHRGNIRQFLLNSRGITHMLSGNYEEMQNIYTIYWRSTLCMLLLHVPPRLLSPRAFSPASESLWEGWCIHPNWQLRVLFRICN
jgi:hypothetical protein